MEALASSPYYSDGMDHGLIFDQWELTEFDQLEMAMERDLDKSPSSESYSATTTTTASYPSARPPAVVGAAAVVGRPRKMSRTAASSWSSSCTAEAVLPADAASGPKILSFGGGGGGNHAAEYSAAHFYAAKPKEEIDVFVPAVAKRSRSASHNQEHIMAERKRREKLSERFIALSAIVPGLKKMDKASVLGDAIKYLRQLQERVKSLEEQVAKRSVESAVLVKKSQLCAAEDGGDDDDDDSSTVESCFDEGGRGQVRTLPEIEARVCERAVLIKIHCENQKAVLVKALSEIEKLHLSVCNTSVIPFTSSSLDITVMTQMEEGFSMTARDLVKKLNSAFRLIRQ